VVCAAVVLSGAVAWVRAPLIPVQYSSVLLSCRALFLTRCCGVWVVSACLWCSCGGVSSVRPPRRGGGWGHRGWWGGIVDGGWHDE